MLMRTLVYLTEQAAGTPPWAWVMLGAVIGAAVAALVSLPISFWYANQRVAEARSVYERELETLRSRLDESGANCARRIDFIVGQMARQREELAQMIGAGAMSAEELARVLVEVRPISAQGDVTVVSGSDHIVDMAGDTHHRPQSIDNNNTVNTTPDTPVSVDGGGIG